MAWKKKEFEIITTTSRRFELFLFWGHKLKFQLQKKPRTQPTRPNQRFDMFLLKCDKNTKSPFNQQKMFVFNLI